MTRKADSLYYLIYHDCYHSLNKQTDSYEKAGADYFFVTIAT